MGKVVYDLAINHFHSLRHIHNTLIIARNAVRNDLSVCVFTDKRYIRDYLLSKIENLSIFVVEYDVGFSNDLGELVKLYAELSKKLDLNESIDSFVLVESVQHSPFYKNKLELANACVSLLNYYVYLFENKISVSYFYQTLASELHRRAFYFIGKRYGVESFFSCDSLLPDKQQLFVQNELIGSTWIKDYYDQISVNSNNSSMSEQIDRVANHVIDSFKSIKKRGGYLHKVRITRLQSLFLRFVDFYYSPQSLNTIIVRSSRRINLFINSIRYVIWSYFNENEFSPEREKFIFFPMSQPGEAQLLVRGAPAVDQYAFLELLALSVPPDYRVYVKLHPRVEKYYDLKRLSKLSQNPSIFFVKSSVPSLELIARSSLNVVINGSVWMESIIYNAPILAVGNGLFSNFRDFPRLSCINDLKKSIQFHVDNPVSPKIRNRIIYTIWKKSFHVERRAGSLLDARRLSRAILGYIKQG